MVKDMYVWGQEEYGKPLDLPLRCVVNLKLLEKKKKAFKIHKYINRTFIALRT